MTTLDDDRTAEALCRLADAQAPDVHWHASTTVVLSRGRQLRARRAGAAAGITALVLALVVGVPAALSGRTPTQPAEPTKGPVHQEPHYAGAGSVATLEPGVQAVNVPVSVAPTLVQAEDVVGLDVQLSARESRVVVHSGPSGGGLGASEWVIAWRAPDAPSAYSAAGPYGIGFTAMSAGPDEATRYALAGAVPSWLPDPTVLWFSQAGWRLDDGATVHAVEIPTFRAPTPDGRLLYFVVMDEAAGERILGVPLPENSWPGVGDPPLVAFVGSDGDVFAPACGAETTPACLENLGVQGSWLGEPRAHFVGGRSVAATLRLPTDVPDVPAPPSVSIAPGIAASGGLSSPVMAGDVTFQSAGDVLGLSAWLTLGPDDGTFSVVASRGGELTARRPGEPVGRFANDFPYTSTHFSDTGSGLLMAGVAPAGTTRVFAASNAGFEQADGGLRYALEIPTFDPPAGSLDPGRRMYLVAFARPATDRLLDMSSYLLFAAPDGTIVDPTCDGAGCSQGEFQAAYDEIRALLATTPPMPTAD